jgi:hypothetical protein
MPQNWWEMFPEIAPSPAAWPRALPGPGGAMPAAGMAPQARLPNPAIDPFQGPPSAFDSGYFAGNGDLDPARVQSPFPGDDGAPPIDRGAVIQQAAAAIQHGADPDAVHARLIQMGHGDQEPPSPFSDLMPGRRPGTIGDSAPPPLSARPAFDDRRGLAPRAAAPGYTQVRLGYPSRRLDPSLAPQKAGGFQKSAQLKGGAGISGPTTLFTNGYPSLPINGSTTRGNPPPNPAAAMSHGLRWAGAAANPRVPPPAPWRQGGTMPPAEVERYADLGMRMYQLHRARGMTPQQAAAWAANAAAESHGNYRLPQEHGGPAYGLYMWEPPRQRAFQEQFGHPIQQSTEEEQLAFRDWELSHSHAWAARRIPPGSSAGDIAAAITQHYEHPGDWEHAMWDRSNIAEAIMRRAIAMPDGANSRQAPGSAGQQRHGISGRRSGPIRD